MNQKKQKEEKKGNTNRGRPRKEKEIQEMEDGQNIDNYMNNNYLDFHWTENGTSIQLVELLAEEGRFNIPIVTGKKAQDNQKKFQSKEQEINYNNAKQNYQVKSFYSYVFIQQKLQNVLQYLYQDQQAKSYFFLKQKTQQPHIIFENGQIVDANQYPELIDFNKYEPESHHLIAIINSVMPLLEVKVFQTLKVFIEILIFCRYEQEDIVIKRWIDHLKENKEYCKDFFDYQLIKAATFQEKENFDQQNKFLNDYLIANVKQNEEQKDKKEKKVNGNQKKRKKNAKNEEKKEKIINQQMEQFQEETENNNEILIKLLKKIYDISINEIEKYDLNNVGIADLQQDQES